MTSAPDKIVRGGPAAPWLQFSGALLQEPGSHAVELALKFLPT